MGKVRRVDVHRLLGEDSVAMISIYETSKRELGVQPHPVPANSERTGRPGNGTAAPVERHPSDGFTTLWEHHRLDLTVEDHVLRTEFAPLFTDADREQTLTRLQEYGWRPRTGTQYEIG